MNYGINALKKLDKSIIFILIGGVIFLNIVPFPALSPILILLLGIILGILIISVFAYDDFNFLFGFYLLGLGIRAFLSFLSYTVSFILNCIPGFLFKNDGWGYSQQGWYIYKFTERGIKLTMETFLNSPNLQSFAMQEGGLSGNITKYDFFTAFIYSITGRSLVSLFFISALAGSITALFIYLIAKELFSKNVARVSVLFAFFWPSFIIWSTQHIKEPMIAMFVCILLWSIFYIYRCFTPGFLLLSIASILVLSKIGRPYLAIVTCMVLFAGLFLFIRHLFKNKFVAVLLIGLLVCLILFLFKGKIESFILEQITKDIETHRSIFEFLDAKRRGLAYGNLAFFKNADIASFGKMLMFSPIGILFAVFAPFPWQLGNINQIIAVPETILFYILLPSTVKGIVFAYRNRFNQSVLLLLIIIGMLAFLGIVEGNVGTLFRHRSIPFYLLFIFTSIGVSLKKNKDLA